MNLKDCFYPTQRLDFGFDDKYQPTAYGGKILDLESRNLVKRRLSEFNEKRIEFISNYFYEKGCLVSSRNAEWNTVVIEIEVPTPKYSSKIRFSVTVDCSTGSVKPKPVAFRVLQKLVSMRSASDAFFNDFLDNILRIIPFITSLDYLDSVIIENMDGRDTPYSLRDELFLDFVIYTEYSYEKKNYRHAIYKKDVCNHTLCEDNYNNVSRETIFELAISSDVIKSAIINNYADFAICLADNLSRLRDFESESR